MRCLHTTTFEIKEADQTWFKQQPEGYATLSHRWAASEILLDEVTQHSAELRSTKGRHDNPGLNKILGACTTARKLSIQWMWIDSCCINKTYSAELLESINSMYLWYREASICITYLSDVTAVGRGAPCAAGPEIFHDAQTGKPSVWFTRGWTLQELLAPTTMHFYNADWLFIGNRTELAAPLAQVTGIAMPYLKGTQHFRDACIATKMSWMAGRETTREEDMAYSMAGIFNVNMNVQYGEGIKAFMRLQEALVAKNDESLFAWRMPATKSSEHPDYRSTIPSVELGPFEWGLLAASPSWFAGCGAMSTHTSISPSRGVVRHRGGFTLTPQGISGPIGRRDHYTAAVLSGLTVVGLIPYHMWLKKREKTTLRYALNCWEEHGGSFKAVQILLRPVSRNPAVFVRTDCQTYELVNSVKNTSYSMVGTVMQPELY